jgi:transcriptional regulator
MYLPKHFAQNDRELLAAFIDYYAFGVLVTVFENRPFASHIPFLYDRDANVLLGHIARANPQWQHFSNGADVMVIFQGPHAYVSPSWYLAPGVPTWNYAVVHVYGTAQALDAGARISDIIERLTEKFERNNQPPWLPKYEQKQLAAIVGIEIRVKEVQGKFKLSQNRSAADHDAVVAKLKASGSENDMALAKLMEKE